MELREEDIRRHYPPALLLLRGFEHAPRIAAATTAPAAERSPGVGTRRAFRPTTPGLVAQRTSAPGAVNLLARIEAVAGGDGLPSPLQATVAHGLRRSIAIAMALSEQVAQRSGLADLKRANAAGSLTPDRRADFAELSTAEALVTLQVFGAGLSVLLAPHAGGEAVEIGSLEEVLTDNAPLALQGALWELDQDLAGLATTEERLVGTALAFAEALMARVAARAATAAGLAPFTSASWRVAADTSRSKASPPRAGGGAPRCR
jgi:hypothetical protein